MVSGTGQPHLQDSIDFSMCSYSAADYVPPSLENSPVNSPVNSPTSTLRGPSATANRSFNFTMDYFAPSPNSASSSSSSLLLVAPPNTPCGSIRSVRSDNLLAIEPEDATSHDHTNAVGDNSIQGDVAQHDHQPGEYNIPTAPVAPMAPLPTFAPSEPSWVTWPFPYRMRMSRSFALPPPYNKLTKNPYFGPPVRTCRCCNVNCSAESLSAELAQESLIVALQLQAIRTKLHTLISSTTMTEDIHSIKLFESVQAFLNLARVIVDEFDEVATMFKVRWEHRLTPLPEPAPPRYFNEDGDDFDDDILSMFPAATFLGDSVIDGDVFCRVWKHCESRFEKFKVVDAADTLLANDFVTRIFNNYVELTKRLRKGNYMRGRILLVQAKLARERKARKEVRMERIMGNIRRIDELETIGDDTCEVEGDDAIRMAIREDELVADAEANDMRRRWNRRQNEQENHQG